MSTGEITITPGYDWQPAADLLLATGGNGLTPAEQALLAITTTRLDATAQPTAAFQPESIGKRELIPGDIQRLTAATSGGLPGSFYTAVTINTIAYIYALGNVTVTGATVGMVPVFTQLAGQMFISGFVSSTDTVSLYAIHHGLTSRTIPAGTRILFNLL